jgi:putative DNA methylase
MENLSLIEVRGESLPGDVQLSDGTFINLNKRTVFKDKHFTCGLCGLEQKTLDSVKSIGHTAPMASYTLQCYCPQCDTEGYNYGGRYFKPPNSNDIRLLNFAEKEWARCKESDLNDYWPHQEITFSHMTHERNPLPDHGYTHWWKMFNTRQLLVHTHLLKSIIKAQKNNWPLDVCEQTLGAVQQHLRYCSMFSFYQQQYDKTIPHFSTADYNPKMLISEINAFASIGAGKWASCASLITEGVKWAKETWEIFIPNDNKSLRVNTGEPIVTGNEIYCLSSTDLSTISNDLFDLVITDPPFGNNRYYADLSDFFYVWLRKPLQKWYNDLPEQEYFKPERTPHSMEAIDNPAEHPDDREDYEKQPIIMPKHLNKIRELTGDSELQEKNQNPLYRPQPSSDFYRQILSACWAEAGRLLKDGGIMAFTFHHEDDQAWIDVLRALFDAGYLLVATYPIRSDESKGESGQFGSKKIEYDIIHVCRKRIEDPQPVSWARMRRWVKSETKQFKELLEHTHGKELPESDLRVILRGKSLEYYSKHYGMVFTGEGQLLDVRDALLGINQLLDDMLEDTDATGVQHPPDIAEPASRLYLRIFRNKEQIARDELHKTLRGTGISQSDLESRGWIYVEGKVVHVTPIQNRFDYFTAPGRNRKVIKTDLDQAHFLIGAALPNSGIKIDNELNNPNFTIKKSVDEILKWYIQTGDSMDINHSARTALQLVQHWRNRRTDVQLTLFEILEESDD